MAPHTESSCATPCRTEAKWKPSKKNMSRNLYPTGGERKDNTTQPCRAQQMWPRLATRSKGSHPSMDGAAPRAPSTGAGEGQVASLHPGLDLPAGSWCPVSASCLVIQSRATWPCQLTRAAFPMVGWTSREQRGQPGKTSPNPASEEGTRGAEGGVGEKGPGNRRGFPGSTGQTCSF